MEGEDLRREADGAGADGQVNDQTAGYVTEYDVAPPGAFHFVTVKGSGHMVPEFRPVQAFAMFERFLTNSTF